MVEVAGSMCVSEVVGRREGGKLIPATLQTGMISLSRRLQAFATRYQHTGDDYDHGCRKDMLSLTQLMLHSA